jgi:hypothetical protein
MKSLAMLLDPVPINRGTFHRLDQLKLDFSYLG